MKLKTFILFIALGSLLVSCGGSKKAARASHKKARHHKTVIEDKGTPIVKEIDKPLSETPKEERGNVPVFKNVTEKYVYDYADIAKEEMKLYGIPASITLAQGVLESSSGQGELTLKSNNHFGIKCNGWEGAKVYHDDDALQECFRKYNNPKYSFRDHSLFLKNRQRYASLFNLDEDDYKGWAKGLKKAGYATDPRYPDKLIGIIERYHLYEYDEEVLGKKGRKRHKENVKTDYTSIRYTVKKGDTLYSISKQYDLTVEELKKLNNLKDNNISIGQKLYVKPL